LAATFNTQPSETRDAQLGGLNRRVVRRIDWAIFLTVLVASLYVLPRWADPNQNSRLDMVVAVVDDHTFRIDNYVHNTVDYARVGDAYYSDKAPGAALLGIPLYAAVDPVLDAVLDEDVTGALANAPAFQATLRADGTGVSTEKLRFAALQVLLAALVAALPTALAAVLVWRLALRFTGAPGASALSALAYGLLTPVFAYSNAVYGHQLAAFLLIGAFALLALGPPRAGALRLLLLGVLLGGVATNDAPNAPRLIVAVPAVFVIAGAASQKLIDVLGALSPRGQRWAAAGLAVALGAFTLQANYTIYFERYAQMQPYAGWSAMARMKDQYAATHRSVKLGDPNLFVEHGAIRFLAADAARANLFTVDEFPVQQALAADDGKGVLLIVLPHHLNNLAAIEQQFPGGESGTYYDALDRLIFAYYRLPPAAPS